MKAPASDLGGLKNRMFKDINAYREQSRKNNDGDYKSKEWLRTSFEGIDPGYDSNTGASDVMRLFEGFPGDVPTGAVYNPGNSYGIKKDLEMIGEGHQNHRVSGNPDSSSRKIYRVLGMHLLKGRAAYVVEVSDNHPLRSKVVDLARMKNQADKRKTRDSDTLLRGILAADLMAEIISKAPETAAPLGEAEYQRYVAATLNPGADDALGNYKSIFIV